MCTRAFTAHRRRKSTEEFALILPNVEPVQAYSICDRIRAEVSSTPILYKNQEMNVAVSVGIAQMAVEKTLEEMIGEADSALYVAKKEGRNRVEQYVAKVAHE